MLRVTPIEPGRPDTDEPRPSPLRVGTANASCEVPQRMLSKPVIPSQPSRCRDLKRQGPPMRRGSAEERARNIRGELVLRVGDRKSTRLNSSHVAISYAVFCLKK